MRPLLLLLLISACVAPVDLGGNDAGCGPSNCAGCCDAAGGCRTDQCGLNGAACLSCATGTSCQAGKCELADRCTLPASVDWAAVAIGGSAFRTIALKNPTAVKVVATVQGISSATGDAARFTSSRVSQSIEIAPNAAEPIEIRFTPTEVKAATARVIIRLSDSCPDQIVSLTGSGVANVLTWSPEPLDCGYLTPGVEKIFETTFVNAGATPVQLSTLRTSSPGEYRLVGATSVTVPSLGSAKLQVGMKPSALGPRDAQLWFDTDLPLQATGLQQLRCHGGGRDIDAVATTDLGTIAYFSDAPTFVKGRFALRNVGTAPDPRANLHLGTDGAGDILWDVKVKSGTATLNELCVGDFVGGVCTKAPIAGSYDKVVGLLAGGQLEVPVQVTPKSAGPKEWEVVIRSDDPDEPLFSTTIRATAAVLPECSYAVDPLALDFGLIASGSTRELELHLRNTGATPCLFSGLALGIGAHPFFSLVGGSVPSQTVAAQALKVVKVRFAPTGAPPATLTEVAATLEFNAASRSQPQATIALAATIGPACLSVVPSHFDFGTIEKTCNSATRTFLVYNTCPTPLEIDSWLLNQPGNEFVAVNTAALTQGTLVNPGASPLTFSLKYRPSDDGRDAARFVIRVRQETAVVDTVVPLTGGGDSQGLNTDALLQGGNLLADILLVIDNSCSMSDKQVSLGAGFPAFIANARAVGLDFQIGVTTSDMAATGGRLVGSPKILSSSMNNLNTLFSQRVAQGTSGSTNEELLAPATAAVTAPLNTTDNAGFLRPGATLGIVSVSDAEDQSPQPVSFYVNQLMNVRPPGRLTLSAIAPLQATSPTPGCQYDGPGGAPRTVAAVTALSGLLREICPPDFNQGLLDLGPSVFGALFGSASFSLSNVPDLTGGKTITVKVDGAVVEPITAGGVTVWSYDATANRIVFELAYRPQPGSAVTATYFVGCIP